MNHFDSAIIFFLNGFSRHSLVWDKTMDLLLNHFLKGGVLVPFLWWAWFEKHPDQPRRREHVLATMLSCCLAIVAARILAVALPFRVRPFREPGLHFLIPYGADPDVLQHWSSFPSDHAVLFFALSAGLYFISKRVGVFAFLYTALVITFPRIYIGAHYPTDIIAGAILGIAIAWGTDRGLAGSELSQKVLRWTDLRPGFFYPLFFLMTYQIAENFDSIREVLNAVWAFFKGHLH